MVKRYILIAWIFLTTIFIGYSQKYVNEFLNVGVSARAQGMSNSVIASVSDISAGYWNPSALSFVQTPLQVGAMHAEWFAGIAKFDYLSVGKALNPIKESFGSISLIRFGIDEIPYTINLISPEGEIQYDEVSEFSAADYAMLLSYAQRIGVNGHWYIGGTTKIIHRSVGSFGKAWGFGADLGLSYRTEKWNLAIVGRDITTTFNAWSFSLTEREKEVFTQTGNVIPVSSSEITKPRIILGYARKSKIGRDYRLITEINLDFTTDGRRNVLVSADPVSMSPSLGLELAFRKIVQIRAGVGKFQQVKNLANPDVKTWEFQPTFGIGLSLGDFQLDYALTDIGDVSDVNVSHIFSIFLNLERKEK